MKQPQAPIELVIVMGVSGCGKTTIAQALATANHWQCFDADNFHSAANKAKMDRDEPLTDADRLPWLQTLHTQILQWLQADRSTVLACSALKRSYRDLLCANNPAVRFIYLNGSYELIAERLSQRKDHFAKLGLLQSQFDALEPPTPDQAIEIDLDAYANLPSAEGIEAIVKAINAAALIKS
jgi:gluconokinase